MKRKSATQPSSFRREVTVRMTRSTSDSLNEHMRRDSSQEQMAFGLAHHVKTFGGTLLLLDELLLPDKGDLDEQSIAGVSPSDGFQRSVYRRAMESGKSIVEFHTHPGSGVPRFSGIDEHHGKLNADYIAGKFSSPTTLAMIVGNNRFDAFDGVIFDRELAVFRQLDRLEILGMPSETYTFEQETLLSLKVKEAAAFDRQRRIPGWNQQAVEEARIGIIGLGGNGAPLLQLLAGIGAARRGFFAICDPDHLEESNLPRIPYAFPEHLGMPKVSVASLYVARKSPGTPVYPFPCRLSESAVLDRIKAATVLFHCGDNDGGRKEANDLAVRYGIPLIDCGCDVIVDGESVEAGGQVRLVLPGQNACLVCCGGYDPAQAALDQMDDAGRMAHAAQGYVRGSDAEATPSVANLNGLTIQHAVSQFLALVNGRRFASWDYLNFDLFTGRTIPAATQPEVECPLCGPRGCVLHGDPPSRPLEETASMRRLHAGVVLEELNQGEDASVESEGVES